MNTLLVRGHDGGFGHIHSVGEMLELLKERGGLYLSDGVRLEALRLAGEG